MEIVFQRLLGVAYQVTNHKENFLEYQGAKFSYGNEQVGEVHFFAHHLLFEKDIHEQKIEAVNWKENTLFFPVTASASPLPFDPFAVTFYLISRYEEYLPCKHPDRHGRFCVTSSVAYQHGFHRKPMLHIIAKEIGDIMQKKYPAFTYHLPDFSILNTYDIDIAYQYRGKGIFRFAGSFIRAVLNGNTHKIKQFYHLLLRKNVTDEFDTFVQHQKDAENKHDNPVHFVLTAHFGKFDRNIDWHSKAFRSLIEQLKKFSDIGIHPSYYSSEKTDLIQQEIKRLENISGLKITKSRQHFLRFSFPHTFEALLYNGITDDYSLGWPDEAGFRASIAISFPFYNISQERKENLMMHPLVIMDRALTVIARLKEEQKKIVDEITGELKTYGGTLTLLRHKSFKNSILN
jgi:hypothetical protein